MRKNIITIYITVEKIAKTKPKGRKKVLNTIKAPMTTIAHDAPSKKLMIFS